MAVMRLDIVPCASLNSSHMISMTGHGRGESRTKAWTAVVECFSVNRKTAEVVCHTERGASWLEPIVRERVLARIARGRVQVNILLSHTSNSSDRILDTNRAATFLREARLLQKKLELPGEITISHVLGAPGVARFVEPSGSAVKETVLAALDGALNGLVATRRHEGLALQAVLKKNTRKLAAIVKKISPLAKRTTFSQRETLLRRIARSGVGIASDDPRLLTEIAIFAERSDITEELHRIASHLDQLRDKLETAGPIGRTLEFLIQELGREFNTIGSKSSDTEISRLVIEAKTELDRLREQIANIE